MLDPIVLFNFLRNSFISNNRLKLLEIKQMLSNTVRLNFHILNSRYHPKLIGHILKKQSNEEVHLYS